MSEFSDRPLVAGSLIGERSFRRSPSGALFGPVFQAARWEAGMNQAQCLGFGSLTRAMDSLLASSISVAEMSWALERLGHDVRGTVYLRKRPKPRPRLVVPPHRLAALDCKCGFYAYFDEGNNPHHKSGNVLGLIEASGTVSAGSRGFRAEKAEIKALIIPLSQRLSRPYMLMRRTYPSVPIFATREAALTAFPIVLPPAVAA